MALSLVSAVILDAPLLKDSLTEEDRALQDRAMAHHLAGQQSSFATREQKKAKYAANDEFLARLAMLYAYGGDKETEASEKPSADEKVAAESSAWAAGRVKSAPASNRKCTSCDIDTPFYNVYRSPCEHYYCQACLSELFELATTDKSLFPPRCCRQAIPLTSVRKYLSHALVQTLKQKSIEFRTPNRVYCSQPTCSTFITQ